MSGATRRDREGLAGAEAIGALREAPAAERRIVVYLRLWLHGRDGQQEVWRDLSETLGGAAASAVLGAFERYLVTLATHARRTLHRRHLACCALGTDEAAVASLVSLAGRADRREARRVAAELVLEAGVAEAIDRAAALHWAVAGLDGDRSGRTLH